MRITIIPQDKAVYKDGVCLDNLPIPMVPSDIRAFQWDGSAGSIEYLADENGIQKQNLKITDLPDWVDSAVSVWETRNIELQEDLARIIAEKAEQDRLAAEQAVLEEMAIMQAQQTN